VIAYAQTDGTDRSDSDSTDLCDVVILPASPLTPVNHALKLAALAEELLRHGRVAVAAGVVRALRKVLARSEAAGVVSSSAVSKPAQRLDSR